MKILALIVIAITLIYIGIDIRKINETLDSQFVSEDEYVELCQRLGGTVVYSVLNYPDCLESGILKE